MEKGRGGPDALFGPLHRCRTSRTVQFDEEVHYYGQYLEVTLSRL
jgi:hypothetical protein